jgi:D-aspartate ligase
VSFRDRDDAVDAFRAMAHAGYSAVLQEYVPGPPSAHFFVDGFVDRKGICRGRLVRGRLRMFPPDFGNSTMTVTVPAETARDALESLDRMLAALDYRGAFNAEFKRDPRDGVAKLIEMNCRPWWFIDFAAHCGIDVSLMIYRDALGLDIATVDGYAIGERCGVLVDDIKAYLALRNAGELSLSGWLGSWGGATSSTFKAGDPLPTLASLAAIGRRNVARRLRTATTRV